MVVEVGGVASVDEVGVAVVAFDVRGVRVGCGCAAGHGHGDLQRSAVARAGRARTLVLAAIAARSLVISSCWAASRDRARVLNSVSSVMVWSRRATRSVRLVIVSLSAAS
jgi:hypothetical protein